MLLRVIGLILTFFLSSQGRAEDLLRIAPTQQTAWITWSSEWDKDAGSSENWNRFCKRLGEQFLTTQGYGFLSGFTCQQSSASPPSPLPPWHFHVTDTIKALEVKVVYQNEAGSHDIRIWSFPTRGSVEKYLAIRILPKALARMIVEGLPSGWSFKYVDENISFHFPESFPLPQRLLIYELFFDKKTGIWTPRPHALIRKKEAEAQTSKDKQSYAIDTAYRPLKTGKVYWVRGVNTETREGLYQEFISATLQGRKANLALAAEEPEPMEEEIPLEERVFGGGKRSNFAGIRYGRSVINANSIVTDVSMISMLAEIGSGPLEGLRWYYDIFPEVKRGSGTSEEYFNLRRASLGWAFKFDTPQWAQPVFGKFDLQPKIGLLDLRSQFSVETSYGTSAPEFDVKNISDLSVEAGLERANLWSRTRIWGSFGFANLGLSNRKDVTVKSARAGLDFSWDWFERGNWDVNLLAFINLENLSLSKATDPNSLDDANLSEVSTTFYLAGLGITVSF